MSELSGYSCESIRAQGPDQGSRRRRVEVDEPGSIWANQSCPEEKTKRGSEVAGALGFEARFELSRVETTTAFERPQPGPTECAAGAPG